MKVLFDHDISKKLRRSLLGHDISTAFEMGWAKLKNGELLRAAEVAGFAVYPSCA